MTIQKAK